MVRTEMCLWRLDHVARDERSTIVAATCMELQKREGQRCFVSEVLSDPAVGEARQGWVYSRDLKAVSP